VVDRGKFAGIALLVTLLLGYFVAIALASFFMPAYWFWREFLGVPALPEPFRDLLVITSAWDCQRLGYDVLQENPCLGHSMNYPRAWLIPGLLGLSQSSTLWLGVFVAMGFFAAVLVIAGHIALWQAWIYGLILCSPSVMLGVERANSDLVVFALLVLGLWLMQHPGAIASTRLLHRLTIPGIAYSILWLAAVLKLFPIVALISALRERPARCAKIVGIGLLLFLVYLAVTLNDIRLINAATPRSTVISYGSMVWLDRLLLPDKLLYSWKLQKILTYDTLRTLLGTVLVLLVTVPCLRAGLAATPSASVTSDQPPTLQLDSFRVGSGIYLATFMLVGNNWDYRLIFLLLTIPQLLAWITGEPRMRPIALLTLGSILLTVWLSRWSWLNLDELCNWFLLGSFTWLLAATVPRWLRQALTQTV
jgi:hypothetical protein